jgi:5-methylcytosine-specific restriction endonuclease McrA
MSHQSVAASEFPLLFGTVPCRPFLTLLVNDTASFSKDLLLEIISCGNHSCGVDLSRNLQPKKVYTLWQVAWKNVDLLKIEKNNLCINVQWQNERPDDNPWTSWSDVNRK